MADSQAAAGVNQAQGTLIKDPSENVRALMMAAIERLDALRDAQASQTMQLADAATKRIDDLRIAETRRIEDLRLSDNRRRDDLCRAENARADDLAALRAEYHEKLAIAEAKRIDAIRSVDVNAVAVASERATQSAQVLANQVAQSADALRTLVATTATTFAQQQQSLQTQITERLALLERSQYESKGKESYADPVLTVALAEIKTLRQSQQQGSGKTEGITASWGVLMSVVAGVVALASLFLATRDNSDKAGAAQTPAIVYVAPPATAPAPVVIQPQK